MLKKNFKLMTTLAITLSLGIGAVTVHAAAAGSTVSDTAKKVEYKVNSNKTYCNPVYSILEKKLGFTEAQINDAAKAGKTAFDLAKEKGMTDDQLRAAIIETTSQKIDQMVTEGKITKDKAATMKTKFATRMQKWDGNLKQHKRGHSKAVYSVLKNKLGFTEVQISDAAKAGKTAFDLAKEKGMTADQLRAAIIEAKSQKIDQMVADGKLEKDKADTIKANFKEKIQKWDGSLVHKSNTTKTE